MVVRHVGKSSSCFVRVGDKVRTLAKEPEGMNLAVP